jgi:hypothetical protein
VGLPDYVRALTAKKDAPDEMGVALAMLAAKGVAAGVGKGLAWVKGPEGQKHLSKLRVTSESQGKKVAEYERKVASTKGETQARWQARLDKARKRYEDLRLKEKLAQAGIVGEGPVLEYRRNLLSAEWDSASEGRKTEIEKQIAQMDAALEKLATEERLMALQRGEEEPTEGQVSGSRCDCMGSAARESGSAARIHVDPSHIFGAAVRRDNRVRRSSRWQKAVEGLGTELAQGAGGLTFRTFAPPGPGRLIKLPLYPVTAQSWSTTGIMEPGDDPILRATIAIGAQNAGPYLLRTRPVDWGRYRVVGVQTQDQGFMLLGNAYTGNLTNLSQALFSLANLKVYNTNTLFVQDQEIAAYDFGIFPTEQNVFNLCENNGVVPGGALVPMAAAFGWLTTQRRNYCYYASLRDYPVVTENATVSIEVRVFTNDIVANAAVVMPFMVSLVVEVVEDVLFGDPVHTGPEARAGATVKAGARLLDIEDRVRYEIISAGYDRRR